MSIKLGGGGDLSDQQNNTVLYQSKHYTVELNNTMKLLDIVLHIRASYNLQIKKIFFHENKKNINT